VDGAGVAQVCQQFAVTAPRLFGEIRQRREGACSLMAAMAFAVSTPGHNL
jgi:hypothetical protein